MNHTANIVPLVHDAHDETPPAIERIPVKAIIAACENYLDVNYAEMHAHLRSPRLIHARRFTWAAIRALRPDFHLEVMGDWFNRDHSTISVGIRRQPIAAEEAEQIASMARFIARAQGRRELGVA